jgi:hypothetical protein
MRDSKSCEPGSSPGSPVGLKLVRRAVLCDSTGEGAEPSSPPARLDARLFCLAGPRSSTGERRSYTSQVGGSTPSVGNFQERHRQPGPVVQRQNSAPSTRRPEIVTPQGHCIRGEGLWVSRMLGEHEIVRSTRTTSIFFASHTSIIGDGSRSARRVSGTRRRGATPRSPTNPLPGRGCCRGPGLFTASVECATPRLISEPFGVQLSGRGLRLLFLFHGSPVGPSRASVTVPAARYASAPASARQRPGSP